jgi:hypothetical protein
MFVPIWTTSSEVKSRLPMEVSNVAIYGCMEVRSVYNNLSKPTGHVMYHQFNIQQLYVLPTLYLCVLYLSENKQRLVPLTA